ncbi:gamma-glutamyltransferase family protein [Urinicoccus timonensis]|uniref:gamma-glutamyltransferase family protein n=1 Tax=Urinicoccus timonensis TaxID=2024205 RepID=UPI000C077E48|nr:gamma-glutamyltransferase family protein [Urinicoccus timonensis]
MDFNPHVYPYPSRRPVVYGRAMTASSNPLTSQVGLDILRAGGNAVDAALAMAVAMTVLEPTCNGLGSDLFALVYKDGRLHGLNASGYAPGRASWQTYQDLGYDQVPSFGPLSINIGGAVDGWIALSQRFGRLPFQEVFQPAISYAREGYPVSETISVLWEKEFEKYRGLDMDLAPLFDLYGSKQEAPKAGEIYKNTGLAQTLDLISKTQRGEFYEGSLARGSAQYIQDQGGLVDFEDYKNYHCFWTDPLSTNYRGYKIHELPPNGHGISVLMALGVLNQAPVGQEEDFLHRQIEATKLAMSLARDYVCDPDFLPRPCQDLLSPSYLKDLSTMLTDQAQDFSCLPSSPSTVYLTAADQEGTMVSLIQSNYDGFGSGLVHPDFSISYNNRAANFVLNPNHPNCLGPRKRSYHTIIPGFITKDGQAVASFGVMGAFMQPQGHVQVLSNLIDKGLNPQAALDCPRWQWLGGKTLEVESDFPPQLMKNLIDRGHDLSLAKDSYAMGRGQIILRLENGIYCGGTEKRTDGHIAVF